MKGERHNLEKLKKLPQKAILKNYIRNKRYEDNQGIFENIDKIEAEGDFTLFNIVDLIDFDISKKDKVKDFESNFKKFSFIINPVFLEILKSKKEKINSKKINSLLTFLKEEIETSFNNPPKLRIYKIKELFDCFDEENFDEDKLCEKIINIYTLEGKLSFYVNNYFDQSFRENISINKNMDLSVYILLLLYSLNKKEKNSTDCSVFKVIAPLQFTKDLFKGKLDLSKGNLFYNKQFITASRNVDEASKYLFEEENKVHSNNEAINNPFQQENKAQNDSKPKDSTFNKKVIFEIYIRKEKKILSPSVCSIKMFSEFPFEDEYVFAPNCVFEVKDDIDTKNQYPICTVRLCLVSNYHSKKSKLGIYRANNKNMFKNIILELGDLKSEDIPLKQENLQELRSKNVNNLEKLDEKEFRKKVIKVINNCPNLKNIDLSMNFLYSESFDKIAESLISLKHLNEIIVSRNNLCSLDRFCELVRNVNLQENCTDSIIPLSKLMVLNFSFNKLNSPCIKSLSKVIKFFDLQVIDLSYNKIKFEGAKALMEKLNETPNLQYLDLSYNNLFSEEYEFERILGKNLKLVGNLHTLKLEYCNLTSESVKLISQNFDRLPHLEVINFSSNRIDQNDYIGSVSISNQFKHIVKLKTLNLGSNFIGQKGIGGFKSVLLKLKHLRDLEELIIEGNTLGYEQEYELLYTPLYSLKNLKVLDFNEISIRDKGTEELGKILKKNLEFLEILQLDGNDITGEGFSKLNFSKQKRLKVLSLSNNKIDDKHLSVFESINYDSLERLLIANNEIKAASVVAIIDKIVSFKSENKIKELNFSNNKIDEKVYNEKISRIEINEESFKNWTFNDESKCIGLKKILDNLGEMNNLKMVNFSSNNLNAYSLYLIYHKRDFIVSKQISLFFNNYQKSDEISGSTNQYVSKYINAHECKNYIYF